MKYKHIIGLDIGTNSLGWSLVKEYSNGKIEIIKSGVHIFPIGTNVDEKTGKEKTKNEQRRDHRGASRMRYRFKLRRKNLKKILAGLDMLPDYSKYIRAKGEMQSYELYKKRADALDPKNKIPLDELGRIFMLLNKYRGFKSNSKKLHKADKELGVVESSYNDLQKLITNSGARTIGEYFFKMHEKAKEWYDGNRWHNANEPIDERAINATTGEFMLYNSNGIRRHYGRYTNREMYLKEFDMIWAAQKEAYKSEYPDKFSGSKQEYDAIMSLPYKQKIDALKEFKLTNYWHIRDYCIYYQRPLRSQKKYVSNCQFERGSYYTPTAKGKRIWKKKAKKACPKSHPLYQEFKIWQKLHQISYSSVSEGVFKKQLKKEWLGTIAEYLMTNYYILLTKPTNTKTDSDQWIGKLLEEKKLISGNEQYSFFIDKTDEDVVGDDRNENKIAGNITYASFRESLGAGKFIELQNDNICRNESGQILRETKLFQLWNILYQAKDGLFKEDDWLKCILTEKAKWGLSNEQAQKLIDIGLVPEYGSYSSKVLKAILPYMRNGLSEYDALKACNRGYINDDNTIGEKVQMKPRVSQLRYQELRNPVVERSISKAIKLINAILDKYGNEIDRDQFEIRVESTRELRKPRQARENERRKNLEKDKLRDQYAKYLTQNKEKLGFKRDIHKYDSIVGKYELWLQMNMNEDDEIFINEFKAFSRITKQEDKLKHKLWLECGRRCPYTNEIINFTDCFSPEVEIEHIIPLSRSLDNSFNNKTLTYRRTNILKGSRTPFEFITKISEDALKAYKSRIKSKHNNFSDEKKKLLMADNIVSISNFSNDQISNTSYIAKFAVRKMKEVCRNVQFTNGAATAELRNYDWALSSLLDKIKYHEDTGIDIDEYYQHYRNIKKDFIRWHEKKYSSTDLRIDWGSLHENSDLTEYINETKNDLLYWQNGINAFNEFRNTSGKKDRSDHRHHAIDAFIIACCSPKIIKLLSTYNAGREEQNLSKREKIDMPFEYEQLKDNISNILVSHSEKQTLIKKRKNRSRTKNNKVIEAFTYAPQGSLHKDTFYRKLLRPSNQGFSKKNVYVSRSVLSGKNGSNETYLFESPTAVMANVYDDKQKQVLAQRFELMNNTVDEKNNKLKPFSEKAMQLFPIFSYTPNEDKNRSVSGKTLPVIKSIRTKYANERSVIEVSNKKYADKGANFMMILYQKELLNDKGKPKKPKRGFELLSFWDAVKSKRNSERLFNDEKEDMPLYNHCQWLKKGDIILIGNRDDTFESIDWENNKEISAKLYRLNEIGFNPTGNGYAVLKFEPHKLQKKSADKYSASGKFLKLSESVNAIKVRLNILGEIVAKGEECFS